jgi:uncharacterized membrane protein YcaP (DUF421 family)
MASGAITCRAVSNMPPKDYAFDLSRIFFGDLPWPFLLEVLLRTAIMYLFALLVVRVLGKRGMGQLAPFDFVIIIALGSAVRDPMFYRSVPLLHAMVAITAVVCFTRGLVVLTERRRKLKDFISTAPTRLVMDGRMVPERMHEEGISRAELFGALRAAGVQQLGQVERAYLEPSGKISTFLFQAQDIRPGVPLLPAGDEGWPELIQAGESAPAEGGTNPTVCRRHDAAVLRALPGRRVGCGDQHRG